MLRKVAAAYHAQMFAADKAANDVNAFNAVEFRIARFELLLSPTVPKGVCSRLHAWRGYIRLDGLQVKGWWVNNTVYETDGADPATGQSSRHLRWLEDQGCV
jgi:hypothetical protein